MKRPRLGINVDHVATLRQARGTDYPDPVAAALLVLQAGAEQVTIHLREDRRHIQDRDLAVLRKVVTGHLNLEMAATDEMVGIASQYKPHTSTLVPEKRKELTTEGGLDVCQGQKKIKKVVEKLKNEGIRVSLFIDPDLEQVRCSQDVGADAIEIHTGCYAEALGRIEQKREFVRIAKAAREGQEIGLEVAAGHGLHYKNVAPLLALSEIVEYNIGHSIIARAIFVGIEKAVREMKDVLAGGK
ncbi:MAG: pyridoxine 5'-phosphate synthase [Deltaproteobacteria bacterium RIFCSPLOWO2_02_FULL_50_16]|nr:MAG: pyridoxine 5'-phosphate synthase [Deltaproteobacteria bacterium RIFCSPHIGHO2_02_FULL_50_15]OGQ57489.1 MAG: pyridoxine 5'-phosphate synthase [Deltaproteobacteria bacterium RIFCSPLOWO2_02_FULL_50_16]OGQ68237.1 MAG: pyridoxine 5'-phosphate synthase [Deltaproteobacteria bacterium RIFCSPLOWO2_12_FULL_50_11]